MARESLWDCIVQDMVVGGLKWVRCIWGSFSFEVVVEEGVRA
jgi:hypothetical protein